mmetsp:Transcript_40860/g.128026  ORF Transcript_40860/g.128026 Transcript_40860/m.128026 type:complete len:200 (-) Transcript_40860:34-633(-)
MERVAPCMHQALGALWPQRPNEEIGPLSSPAAAAATRSVQRPTRPQRLGTGLLLLLLVQGKERHTGDLHHLETHTRDITDGVAGAAETGDEHLVVLIDEVEAAIVRHEGGDLLAVLDELHAHALTDSRVRLLGLNTHLLHDDALSHGRTAKRVRLHGGDGVRLHIALGGPLLLTAEVTQLAASADTRRLTLTHLGLVVS